MDRILSSRAVGITLCVISSVGLALGLIQLIRGSDPWQGVEFILMELGGLVLGVGVIRRAGRLEAPEPE